LEKYGEACSLTVLVKACLCRKVVELAWRLEQRDLLSRGLWVRSATNTANYWFRAILFACKDDIQDLPEYSA
jgi:hypothetical protein